LAVFKAGFLNNFVKDNNVTTVIEYGCGDGNQLELTTYNSYVGFDVSPVALSRCREVFCSDKTKSFKLMDDYDGETAELTVSLDVVYHLTEDEAFESYMRRLFGSSTQFVIVYSSNKNEQDRIQVPHIRHRRFTEWVDAHAPGWKLIQHVPNKYPQTGDPSEGSFSDFYVYEGNLQPRSG
jgi:SAM-dependent methyltransferase